MRPYRSVMRQDVDPALITSPGADPGLNPYDFVVVSLAPGVYVNGIPIATTLSPTALAGAPLAGPTSVFAAGQPVTGSMMVGMAMPPEPGAELPPDYEPDPLDVLLGDLYESELYGYCEAATGSPDTFIGYE